MGHVKLIDEFESEPNSPHYATVKQEQIKIYNKDAEDTDCVVKLSCALMIAAVS